MGNLSLDAMELMPYNPQDVEFTENGKIGWRTKDGKILIPAKYDQITNKKASKSMKYERWYRKLLPCYELNRTNHFILKNRANYMKVQYASEIFYASNLREVLATVSAEHNKNIYHRLAASVWFLS